MDTVRDALLSARLAPGRPVVAAVSGGADSMALLEALRLLAGQGDCEVVAAHFNHGLRGGDSDADQSYVAGWCRDRGLRCVTGGGRRAGSKIATRASAGSPEGAARVARYEFLARVCADLGASGVATGHTLDDQAETVLLHLVRGAGLAGARGMRLVSEVHFDRAMSAVTVVRPLLGLTRADTEAFCAARSIHPRMDASNLDVNIPRNLVRHRALPLLAAINPAVSRTLARFSAAAGDDLDFISGHAGRAWAEVVQDRSANAVAVSRGALRKLAPALKRRVLIRMYEEAAGSAERLALDHVDAMSALCDGRSGTSLDLPGGLVFAVEYRRVAIRLGSLEADRDCPFPPSVPRAARLAVPGMINLDAGFQIGAEPAKAGRTSKSAPQTLQVGPARHDRFEALLNASVARRGLTVRARRPGDLFHPQGMSQPKKLQDFFVDSKVPRSWRDRVPLVVGDSGIAWVAGYRVAEWARARRGSPAIRVSLAPPTGS